MTKHTAESRYLCVRIYTHNLVSQRSVLSGGAAELIGLAWTSCAIRSNRLVLLRLHGVVSPIHQNRAKPPAALSRSAEQLRINAQSAVMRNCSALRLRLAPDGGFAQLFLTACISQQALASGEQYVWPEVSRRTGSSSRFGDLMGE